MVGLLEQAQAAAVPMALTDGDDAQLAEQCAHMGLGIKEEQAADGMQAPYILVQLMVSFGWRDSQTRVLRPRLSSRSKLFKKTLHNKKFLEATNLQLLPKTPM